MCYFVTNESKNHHFHGLFTYKSACGLDFIGLVSFSGPCASFGWGSLSQGCSSWLCLWPPLGNSFLYFVKCKASGLGLVTTYGASHKFKQYGICGLILGVVAVTLAMNYGVIYADKAKQVETLDKKIAEKEENNQEIAKVTKTNEKLVADIKAEYHKATVKEIPNNPTLLQLRKYYQILVLK